MKRALLSNTLLNKLQGGKRTDEPRWPEVVKEEIEKRLAMDKEQRTVAKTQSTGSRECQKSD